MPYKRMYRTGKPEWELVSEEQVKRTLSSCYHGVNAVIVEMKENPGRVVHTQFSSFVYFEQEQNKNQ